MVFVGLSLKEVEERQKRFGANEIVEKASITPGRIFVSQFVSPLVILLVVAAGLAFVLGDALDGLAITLIVFLNGILGFFQEYKAEKAIEALKKIIKTKVRVVRDGVESEVESTRLVPGDVVILAEGDKIPADARILEEFGLEVNEASLTGESMPVEKDVVKKGDEVEERNLVYLGTVVARGRCTVEVVTTGMKTRFGGIATGLSEIKEGETPLQKKLTVLGKYLGILAVLAGVAVLVVGYWRGEALIEMILVSVSLVVAAVPEGLPAVVTIALAVGMQRMAKRKAILRKLSAIEALGSVSVIATDKTGTLTKNDMRVTRVWFENKTYKSNDRELSLQNESFRKLLMAGLVANNASLVYKHDHGTYNILGDSTEGALLLLAQDYQMNQGHVKESGEILAEYAFDSELKRMSVIWKNREGINLFVKGAPELILEQSTNELVGGKTRQLSEERRKIINIAFREFANIGLRVIALATKEVESGSLSREEAEVNLTWLGFVGITDPPRAEVKEAIEKARRAGVRTVMITGDNELTANAIATEIGLIDVNEEVITGEQFEKLTDEEARVRLLTIRIFARTSPDQKLRIVKLLQAQGEIVVVTGDGVNDALALKQADVGVAMGITGTDVAKEAADMVITDDNYATLVTAIEEGRTIFANIRSSVKFLVGCNIGEVLAVLGGVALGWPIILTPLQILYVNLISDGLPALALAMTPKDARVMLESPNSMRGVFRKKDKWWLLEIGLLTAGVTMGAFAWGYGRGGLGVGRAMAFTALIFVQHFIFLDVWMRNNSIFESLTRYKDKLFLLAFFLPLSIQPIILYVPALADLFKVGKISIPMLLVITLVSTITVWVSEVRKCLEGVKNNRGVTEGSICC